MLGAMETLRVLDLSGETDIKKVTTILNEERRALYKEEWKKWIELSAEAFEDVKKNGLVSIQKHNKERLKSSRFEVSSAEFQKVLESRRGSRIYKSLEKFYAMNAELARKHMKVISKLGKQKINIMGGLNVEYKLSNIERIGIYTSPQYPSTFLHIAALARVAGIKPENIVVCSYDSKELPENIILAANIAGIKKVFIMSGRYAIAAMTLGIEGVMEPVNMIVGPASAWVDAAKRFAQMEYGTRIDLPAGPTETAVVTKTSFLRDETVLEELKYEAVCQLEHGAQSQCFIVVQNDSGYEGIFRKLEILVREYLISIRMGEDEAEGFLKRIVILITDTEEKVVEMLNTIAPEYVVVISGDKKYSELVAKGVHNAGTITVNVPSAMVDYSPETCLSPTWGFAKSYSKFNVMQFFKIIPVIRQAEQNAMTAKLYELVTDIVNAEGFVLHKEAVGNYIRKGKKSTKSA